MMSSVDFYLTPGQWEEIDTYEARSSLIMLCEQRIMIECKKPLVVAKRKASLLPERLLALSTNLGKIDKVLLTIEEPKYLSISASIFSDDLKRHILNEKGEEVLVSKRWGSPEMTLNHYGIFGSLVWPRSTVNELVFASEHCLKMSLEESDCRPID